LFEISSFPSGNHEHVINLKMTSRDIFFRNPREFIFCLLFEILIFLQVSITIITSQNKSYFHLKSQGIFFSYGVENFVFPFKLQRWCWRTDCGNGVGAAIMAMMLLQLLWQWRDWRSDCGGSIGCGSGGIGWHNDCGDGVILAVVAAMALVGHSDYGVGVSATIVVVTCWRKECGSSGAVIASVQRLQQQWQRSDCGCGAGTMIAAMSLVGAVIAVTGVFV
jgi:hypothetical protein